MVVELRNMEARVKDIKSLVNELKTELTVTNVYVELLQRDNSDLQTRLSSSESDLLLCKSSTDQLERENAVFHQWIREAVEICEWAPTTVNRDEEAYQLSHTWDTVLQRRPLPSDRPLNSRGSPLQDVVFLDFDGAGHVAKSISSHFSGDREATVVLDVACATGPVAKTMKEDGFGQFVGIDGSKVMLEKAQKKGLYQDLKQCILGEQPLPVQRDAFDVVVICGALGVNLVPISVIGELCIACKPGGYVCMTCRHSPDNLEYKAALERALKQMQDEELWSCVAVTEVEKKKKIFLY